jgi:hypothetical protein
MHNENEISTFAVGDMLVRYALRVDFSKQFLAKLVQDIMQQGAFRHGSPPSNGQI